jgi:hypothetical protein
MQRPRRLGRAGFVDLWLANLDATSSIDVALFFSPSPFRCRRGPRRADLVAPERRGVPERRRQIPGFRGRALRLQPPTLAATAVVGTRR